jgi:Protein of unknown function (DUF1566)/K319L-like, PKD domain
MKTLLQRIWIIPLLTALSACNGGSSPAPVATPENRQPIADAGVDITTMAEQLVTLDGSNSLDPDEDDIVYKWIQISGPLVTLSSEVDDSPSFIAPANEATLRYQLYISDGIESSIPDTVTITVIEDSDANTDANSDGNSSGGNGSGSDSSGNNTDGNSDNSDDNTDNTGDGSDNSTDSTNNGDNSTGTDTDTGTNTDTSNDNTNVNQAPIADAGEDFSAQGNELVSLDSSNSYDPDNDAITFQWTQLSGQSVLLNDNNIAYPSFIAPNITEQVRFALTVNDGSLDSSASEVSIDLSAVFTNLPPVANAGTDQNVAGNALVSIDGTLSQDPENAQLSFQWQQLSGPVITLSSADAAQTSFTAPEEGGVVELSLEVHDGELSASDTLSIIVSPVSQALHADAGDNQAVRSNTLVTLDGSESSSDASETLTYTWRQSGGPNIILSSLSAAQPSFTTPSLSTPNSQVTLSFTLVVSNGTENSAADFTTVTVSNINTAPIANAGLAQALEGNQLVTLDGSASADAENDTLDYLWTQTQGPSVDLTNSDMTQAQFTAPREGGEFQFSLVVTDGELSSEASLTNVSVSPVNNPPIANAGVDRYVGSHSIVALKGSNSSDPDDDPLSYLWSQVSGPTITLNNLSSANPTFEGHTDGVIVISLVVNDGHLDSEIDLMRVTIGPIPATNIRVNGTGITWGASFPTGNNIDCSGELFEQQDCALGRELTHNDDSDGRAGFNFSKFNSDGVETDASDPEWDCVQDEVTGLMWEVKQGGNDIAGDEGLNDADDKYSWYNSDSSSNGGAAGFADSKGEQCHAYDAERSASYCNTQAYVNRMNSAGWCGYADWRLPNRKELLSIIDYGNTKPMIDNGYFPSNAGLTWTASPFAIGDTSAWGVNFSHGNSYSLDKRNANQVRLVRGGYE